MNVMDCSFICKQMSFCLFVTVFWANAHQKVLLSVIIIIIICYQVFACGLAHGDISVLCNISLPLSWTGRRFGIVIYKYLTWKYLQIAILSSRQFNYLQLSSIFFRGFCECIKFYVSDSNFGHIQVSPICRASIMQGLFL